MSTSVLEPTEGAAPEPDAAPTPPPHAHPEHRAAPVRGARSERPKDPTTRHGFERMVFFSDAVVAIAVTLLVLPLVDLAREIGHRTIGEFLGEHLALIVAAVLSFVLVSLLWRQHHRLFERATGYVPSLLHLNAWWIGSIATLPVTTLLSAYDEADAGGHLLYIGSIGSASIALTVIWATLRRHRLLEPPRRPAEDLLVTRLVAPTMILAWFVLTAALPQFEFWELVLLLIFPIRAVIVRIASPR